MCVEVHLSLSACASKNDKQKKRVSMSKRFGFDGTIYRGSVHILSDFCDNVRIWNVYARFLNMKRIKMVFHSAIRPINLVYIEKHIQ